MMITYIWSLLVVAFITTVLSASEFSLKGDPCSRFDSCSSKHLKTCSCESGCELYGTCCHDLQKSAPGASDFKCYHYRTSPPVFAMRSCSDDFKGHSGDKAACFDEEVDEMDVKNTLLVTSHKTKITYWNKMCAKCNDELKEDLEFWNIEVFCPAHEMVDTNSIRRNLTFDKDKNQWGLHVGDEFLQCIVKYAPPPYIEQVYHCTPNLISSCPADYSVKDIAVKCSQYYAERKLKDNETYYKNVHCAICNGVDVKQLECPGMFSLENNVEETDFGEVFEETFENGNWLPGKLLFEACSTGFTYDPFQARCRRDMSLDTIGEKPNASPTLGKGSWALLVFSFVFLIL